MCFFTKIQQIYVVNELLMYVISKLDADNQNDIKNVVYTFYGDEAASDAKSLLWEHHISKLDRSITRQSKVKNVDDILDAIRIINVAYPDKDTLPVVFVAIRTSNLPFVCEKISPSRESFVESRLATLELQMVEVLARPTMPIADNVRLYNVSYSSRIKYGTASNARKYECVVFNVTTSDKSEVSKWISDGDVNVMNVSRLSKDDADAHLFKWCVEYKVKYTVLCSDFWPENVGCRPVLELGSSPTGPQTENSNIMADSL